MMACGGVEELGNSLDPTNNDGGAMSSEIRNAINYSMLFPSQQDGHEERIGSGRHKLQEPRELYSAASLQHPPKWPIECQVVPDKIRHFNIPPASAEPFYNSTGSEPQPGAVGDEMGTVIYDYQPKLCVDYYCRSCFGGSEELTVYDTDDTTLKFESRFEAGNLAKVIKVTNVYYELYLRADMYTDRHAQWYYFRIRNTRENVVYRFSIVNLSKPDSLYRYGMKPLMYSEKEAEINGVGWIRCGHNISYYKNDITAGDNASSYTLTFNLKFEHGSDTVYIAQCYPYTYSHLQSYLHEIQSDKNKARLCQQRLLCKSLAGNNVYVLTITTPESEEDQVKKPAIVLTARVHPGETPSSYMMKGIIDFLTSDSSHAQDLRDRFIFKLIPMLNPDGVIVGNSRCCLLGQDLNRQYRTVLREAFPQIYQKKVLLRRLVDENGIFLYCDIHGHSRKNNVFMYGCENRRVVERKLTEQVFPLMMHKNAADKFSFSNCKFRIQKSKEGTGRIFVWTLGVTNSYTLEISLCGSTLVSRERTHFNFVDYEDLGRHFCETLLDYSDTAALKEKIRQKILQKLIDGGSTADEPVNIPISDYSSLSHSDSDNDESDTTEDDDEIELRKTKPAVARQASVRKMRAKKLIRTKSERSPLQLKAAQVDVDTSRGDRIQRKSSQSTVLLQAFREERKSGNLRPGKLNFILSPRKTRRPSFPIEIASVDTTASTIKCTNLRFDDPFRLPEILVTTNDSPEEVVADTGTQTEDECDYTDASMKNEFYLPGGATIGQNTLLTSFKSMNLQPTPKRTKLKKRPTSSTAKQFREPKTSKPAGGTKAPVPSPTNIRNPERRRSLPTNDTGKKNFKIQHSKSQDEIRNKLHPFSASSQAAQSVLSSYFERRTFLNIPGQSKGLPALSPTRRVSWGEGATVSTITMSRFQSELNVSTATAVQSKKVKSLYSIRNALFPSHGKREA